MRSSRRVRRVCRRFALANTRLNAVVRPQPPMDQIRRRIDRFQQEFLDEMAAVYASCSDVENIGAWYARLDELTLVCERGGGTYRQVEDHIFELKVMNYLRDTFSGVRLTYEPRGTDPTGRTCDIRAQRDGRTYLIEIKSFHPERRTREVPRQHIEPNNNVVMDGESYHSYQATRGHLIDVTYETEEKLRNYPRADVSVLAVPTGFHLHEEDVRDFVYIYRNGAPRPDDPLGPMTMHNLRDPFAGTITEFWTFPFPQEGFGFLGEDAPRVVGPRMHMDRPINVGAEPAGPPDALPRAGARGSAPVTAGVSWTQGDS